MPDLKWLIRGAQSAVFFYLSCGPIYDWRKWRKRWKQAKLSRQMKEKMKEEQPDAYHHPAPFDINPYWAEEIALGPHPPPRRARNKNSRQGRSGTANTQSTTGTATSATSATSGSSLGDSLKKIESLHLSGHSWGMRRYQRADEELIVEYDEEEGDDVPEQGQNRQQRGSSVGLGGWSSKPSFDSYYIARAPPVNDLHPPIVSTFSSNAADNAWMKAPPPTARFMNGHGSTRTKSNRSRSNTGAGNQTGDADSQPLSVKQQDPGSSKGESTRRRILTSGDQRAILSAEQETLSSESQSQPAPPRNAYRKKRRPAPIRVSEDLSSDGDSDSPTQPARPKPTYAPIKSSASAPRARSKPKRPAPAALAAEKADIENRHHPEQPVKRPNLERDSSLNVLQELVSHSALLNSQFLKGPAPLEAKIRLPPADELEAAQLMLQAGGIDLRRDSIYENWMPVPVPLKRHSMDI